MAQQSSDWFCTKASYEKEATTDMFKTNQDNDPVASVVWVLSILLKIYLNKNLLSFIHLSS